MQKEVGDLLSCPINEELFRQIVALANRINDFQKVRAPCHHAVRECNVI